ncbi:tRNA methyl transferase [Nitzschia inconspicua]|uniref:tRNA methyl transferase n=1 Tax=Nitzschia inconspicua TaxID=303405 RepID=A0A9K3PTM5_9STRA|nr:tRNA methyl transferase [Nitzschia inconspicua]
MQHTQHEASLGRTPNADIQRNSRVKCGCFLEYSEEQANSSGSHHIDYIASGHYAPIRRLPQPQMSAVEDRSTPSVRLYRAPDPARQHRSYRDCKFCVDILIVKKVISEIFFFFDTTTDLIYARKGYFSHPTFT